VTAETKVACIVCGDRNYDSLNEIVYALEVVQPDLVIEGGASGADTFSWMACKQLGIKVEEHRADWPRYGKAAGVIRNKEMLDRLVGLWGSGWEVMVLAFHDQIEESVGTKDMIRRAEKAGVRCWLYERPHKRRAPTKRWVPPSAR
jgi:hypothetical protein